MKRLLFAISLLFFATTALAAPPPFAFSVNPALLLPTGCTNGQYATYTAATNRWSCASASGAGDILADGSVPFTGQEVFGIGLSTKNGATSPGFVDFFEDSDNGASYFRLYGPDALAGNIFMKLPETAGATGGQLYFSAANTLSVAAAGAEGKIWQMGAAVPAWSAYTLAAPGAVGAGLFSDGTNWARNTAPSLLALTLYGQAAGAGAQLALGSSSGSTDPNDGKINFNNLTNANQFSIKTGATGAGVNGWILPTANAGGANYLLNVDADGTMGYTDPDGFATAHANLTAFAGLTLAAGDVFYVDAAGALQKLVKGAANTLFGMNSAGTIPEWKSSLSAQFDDSAAQFKSATASKGTLKFDQTGITDTKVVTVKYTATDDVTHNPTLTSTSYSFGAINVITTGTLSGGIPVSSDADGMDAAAMTAAGMYGTMFIATGAGTWILPRAVLGQSACLMDSGTAHDLILDVTAGSTIRLKGAEGSDGVGITNASGSSTGDFICVIAVATDKWSTVGMQGTWASQ